MTLLSRHRSVMPATPAQRRNLRHRRNEFALGLAVVLVTLLFVVAVGALGLLALSSALH